MLRGRPKMNIGDFEGHLTDLAMVNARRPDKQSVLQKLSFCGWFGDEQSKVCVGDGGG